MSFNPLKEKGLPLEKQLRNWHQIAARPYKKQLADAYTRVRQIFLNGIEVEAWGFKHQLNRYLSNIDGKDRELISRMGRIENQQQMTCNWLCPSNQSVLETTLGYEQVAVDLTAYLAQVEPDNYVKETFDFGLLEDFDHLYRYAQFAYTKENVKPDDIVQNKTDVILGRTTQFHHNCNALRLRKPYDKNKTCPRTKVNILTLLSAEQQTHNFYAEHGFMYGDQILRETYAEIKDVEEEHVTMYESLIAPDETMFEKLLLHEFCEVCNYYSCYQDEECNDIKKYWEIFLEIELEHLKIAADLFKKYEKRDPYEIIGEETFITSRFESQKSYVQKVLNKEVNKRLKENGEFYYSLDEIPNDWASYEVQTKTSEVSSPSENAVRIAFLQNGIDVTSIDKNLKNLEFELLEKGMQKQGAACNTVQKEEYLTAMKKFEEKKELKSKKI